MLLRIDVRLLFSITLWIAIGLIVGQLVYTLVARRRVIQDATDRPFALIVALIGSCIGGTVGWSLPDDGLRFWISLVSAPVGALALALVFHVIAPV